MKLSVLILLICCLSSVAFAAVADISVSGGAAYADKPMRITVNLRTANLTNYQYFSVSDNPINKPPLYFNASPSANYYTVNYDVLADASGVGRIKVVSDRAFTYTTSFAGVDSSDLSKQLSFLLGGMVALAFTITFAQRL